MARRIGMLIFPRLTQLDMTGPYEVLARLPNTKVDLVAQDARAGDDRPRHADRADRDLCRLPAARPRHGAGRARPAGPDGGRGGAGVPAQAGGGREIRHLGLHRLAGARRRRPAQGQARHLPLGGDRASGAARRHPDQRARRGRRQYRHRRRASPPASTSRWRSPPSSRARRWPARSSSRSNTTPIRPSTAARRKRHGRRRSRR